MKDIERLRENSMNYKLMTKEQIDQENMKNLYKRLLIDMESMSIVGCKTFRIFPDMKYKYGFDDDNVYKIILEKLTSNGFVVSNGSSRSWWSLFKFIQISWE